MRLDPACRLPLFLAVIMALVPESGTSQIRVAVLPFTEGGDAVGTELGSRVAGLLTLELEGSKVLFFTSQEAVRSAMANHGLKPGHAIGRDPARAVARELGASHIILGSVGGKGGEIQIQGLVLGVGSDFMESLAPVAGSLGDVVPLARSFARLIPPALEVTSGPLGDPPFVEFEKEYQLTSRQMWGEDGSHGYRILQEDPVLGWKLGVRCVRRRSGMQDSCSQVIFRLSDDLHRSPPDRGVDGYWVFSFSSEVPGAVERYAEVQLERVDRVLSFSVDLIWSELERSLASDLSHTIPRGVRVLRVRVRFMG